MAGAAVLGRALLVWLPHRVQKQPGRRCNQVRVCITRPERRTRPSPRDLTPTGLLRNPLRHSSDAHRNLREAAWRGGATVVADEREASHVVVTGGIRRGQTRPLVTSADTGAVEVTVEWLLAACRGDVAGVPGRAGEVCRVNG